jgi:hypothetical protein
VSQVAHEIALRRSRELQQAVLRMGDALADLDDTIGDELAERIAQLAQPLENHLYWALKDFEEQAVRGLGDPAVTGSGNHEGEGHVPFAPEPVGRGRKTRGRS